MMVTGGNAGNPGFAIGIVADLLDVGARSGVLAAAMLRYARSGEHDKSASVRPDEIALSDAFEFHRAPGSHCNVVYLKSAALAGPSRNNS